MGKSDAGLIIWRAIVAVPLTQDGEGAKLAIRANFDNLFNTSNLTPFTGYQSIASLQGEFE